MAYTLVPKDPGVLSFLQGLQAGEQMRLQRDKFNQESYLQELANKRQMEQLASRKGLLDIERLKLLGGPMSEAQKQLQEQQSRVADIRPSLINVDDTNYGETLDRLKTINPGLIMNLATAEQFKQGDATFKEASRNALNHSADYFLSRGTKDAQEAANRALQSQKDLADLRRKLLPQIVEERKTPQYVQEFRKNYGNKLIESNETLNSSLASLMNINDIKKTINDDKAMVGFGANWKSAIGNILVSTFDGFEEFKDPVAATEMLAARLKKQALEILRNRDLGSGSGVTERDLDFAIDTSGGKITFSKEGLKQIIAFNEQLQRHAINRFNARLERFKQISPQDDLGLDPIPMPEFIEYKTDSDKKNATSIEKPAKTENKSKVKDMNLIAKAKKFKELPKEQQEKERQRFFDALGVYPEDVE